MLPSQRRSFAANRFDVSVRSPLVTGFAPRSRWFAAHGRSAVPASELSRRDPEDAADHLLVAYDGMPFGPEKIPDVVRFPVDDWDVDLFVAKTAHARKALERAVPVGSVEFAHAS